MLTKNCLILAAGTGSRISNLAKSKPLIEVAGRPLIQHVLENAISAGLSDFYVVSGYNGQLVRNFLDFYAKSSPIKITHIINKDWERSNGVSVHLAKSVIPDPFFLLMSDHLFDASIMSDMNQLPIGDNETLLAIDRNLSNTNIDINDVTKVMVRDNDILDIGKSLRDYDAFDTGIFKCTHRLFDALEKSSELGDDSLSGGIKQLAQSKLAKTFDINKRFWIDVDDENMLKLATTHFKQ